MATPTTKFNNHKNKNKATFTKEIKFIIKKKLPHHSEDKPKVPALSYNLFTDAFFPSP